MNNIFLIFSESNASGKLYFFKGVEAESIAQDLVSKLNLCMDSLDPDEEIKKLGAKFLGIYQYEKVCLESDWDLK